MTGFLGSTAEVCAALRTLGAVDPLAHRFLRGARVTSLARIRPLQPLLRTAAPRLVKGAFAYEVSRTGHLDEAVARELRRGARQLVLLGAGFDSRGHRFPVQTFEVDLPALSRRKRRLADGLAGHVVYVEADFERDDPLARLAAAGFDASAPTVVLWIGVSMYVSAPAVERVLGFVAALAPGSTVIFDYVFAEPTRDFVRAVERRGEPIRFRTNDVRTLVERHGLELERDVGPQELVWRLGGVERDPYPFIAIAQARVRWNGLPGVQKGAKSSRKDSPASELG
jgi:methyltransferase (TIGR00027 family)